jgi:uncharacterized membrane protein YgdD (TMEM256/DUF423 family)
MSSKKMLLIGALLGALSVGCGAFGAHGMPNYLTAQNRSAELIELDKTDLTKQELETKEKLEKELELHVKKRLNDWEIASRYLMYTALAVIACGLLAQSRPSRSLSIACWLLLAGVLLFSGFLYLLVLTEQRWMGATFVPIGGVLMICGWISLAYAGGGYCSRECAVRKSDA